MSIYSGFSTRNQESTYGKLCEDLVIILANRVLKALKSEAVDDSSFSKTLISIYTRMGKLELHKYLPPKLSQCCNKLAVYCTNVFQLSNNESVESFSRSKIEYELPLINEEVKVFRSKPVKSTTHTRGKNFSPDRVPSSISQYARHSDRRRKYTKASEKAQFRGGECVQLNDGMFYRLI